MTALHEGVSLVKQTSEVNDGNLEATEKDARRQYICAQLGAMVPSGEVVVDYAVKGTSYCSPVKGNIYVTTSSTAAADDLGERVVHPSRSREAFDLGIIPDLNLSAEEWHSEYRPAQEPWHRDK